MSQALQVTLADGVVSAVDVVPIPTGAIVQGPLAAVSFCGGAFPSPAGLRYYTTTNVTQIINDIVVRSAAPKVTGVAMVCQNPFTFEMQALNPVGTATDFELMWPVSSTDPGVILCPAGVQSVTVAADGASLTASCTTMRTQSAAATHSYSPPTGAMAMVQGIRSRLGF